VWADRRRPTPPGWLSLPLFSPGPSHPPYLALRRLRPGSRQYPESKPSILTLPNGPSGAERIATAAFRNRLPKEAGRRAFTALGAGGRRRILGPVIAGDRVWVHSRRGGKEVVSALLLGSGEVLWSGSYDAPFRQDDDAGAHGRGPYSTPTISGGRLFTFASPACCRSGMPPQEVSCGGESPERSSVRASLISVRPPRRSFGGNSVLSTSEETIEARPTVRAKGAMVALRVADGREEWRWAGDGPAVGASPVISVIAGDRSWYSRPNGRSSDSIPTREGAMAARVQGDPGQHHRDAALPGRLPVDLGLSLRGRGLADPRQG